MDGHGRSGRRRSRAAVAAAGATFLGLIGASALGAQGDTILVSRQSATAGGGSTNEFSSRVSLSGSGRFAAFESGADNLSDATVSDRNIFVRDAREGVIILVSRRSGANGAGADGISEEAVISANGERVVFESESDNLSGAAQDVDNVYVRDLERNKTILASRRSGRGAGADANARTPSISRTGRFVAFSSDASNLSRADAHEAGADLYTDIFVRDLKRRKTILVSRRSSSAGGGPTNEDSFGPSISANGRYVAFGSNASNLSGSDSDAGDLFVRDLKRKRTILVSRQSATMGGQGADATSGSASISGDGRFVAFQSDAQNLSGVDGDGRDIFLRDMERRRTSLVSRRSASAGGEAANDESQSPWISLDGRFIAFQSEANNLAVEDDDDVTNVFVRGVKAKRTTLASVTSAGVAADGPSFAAAISADGRFVAFVSDAANLSDDDAHDIVLGDLHTDVFRHDLLGQ